MQFEMITPAPNPSPSAATVRTKTILRDSLQLRWSPSTLLDERRIRATEMQSPVIAEKMTSKIDILGPLKLTSGDSCSAPT